MRGNIAKGGQLSRDIKQHFDVAECPYCGLLPRYSLSQNTDGIEVYQLFCTNYRDHNMAAAFPNNYVLGKADPDFEHAIDNWNFRARNERGEYER